MRTPFQGVSAPEIIRPVAQPVNTYVRPAEPAPSNLNSLAQGLAALDQGLGNFLKKREGVQNDADQIRGQQLFNETNATGWADAVRQGKVPANASPVLQASYKAAQGDLAGMQLQQQFNKEYLQWDGRFENDPQKFQQFLGDFIQKNAGSDDVGVLRGMLPHINQLRDNAYKAWTTDSSKALLDNAASTHAARITRLGDATEKQGLVSKDGPNYEGLFQDAMKMRDEEIKSGRDPASVDDGFVGSILQTAVEHGDEAVLKVFDKKIPGRDVTYSEVYRKNIEETVNRIHTVGRQAAEDLRQAQTEKDKVARSEIWAGITSGMVDDPRKFSVPDAVYDKLTTLGDGKARQTVAEMRSTFLTASGLEDPETTIKLEIDAAAGKITRDDVVRMVGQHKITNVQTAKSLLEKIDKSETDKAKGSAILEDPGSKFYQKQIALRAHNPGWVPSMFGDDAMSEEGLQAYRDFQTELFRWSDANPNPTYEERAKAISQIGDSILGHIDRTLPGDDPNKYQSASDTAGKQVQEELLKATPQKEEPKVDQPAASAVVDQPKVDQKPAEEVVPKVDQPVDPKVDQPVDPTAQPKDDPNQLDGSETERYYSGDKPPAWQDLPEDMKSAIGDTVRQINENLPEDKKLTIEDLNDQIWKHTQEQMGKQGVLKKTSLEGDSQFGKLIEAAYTEEDQQQGDTPFDAVLGETTPVKAGTFEDPMTSPKLNPRVVAKYAGRHVPVSIRNNNPAAISINGDEMSSFAARQPGYVGMTKRPANEGGFYAKYSTPEAGLAAASKLLERYGTKGINTTDQIVRKWSTGANAWNSYSRTLQKFLRKAGYEVDGTTELDLSDPGVRLAILMAKSAHESGAGVPVYNKEVFSRALKGDLGIETPATDTQET